MPCFPTSPGWSVALGMLAAGPWDESSLRDIRDDSIDRQIGHYIDRDDMVDDGDVDLRQRDRPLRPLPRPQVRPDLAGGLLQPCRRFSPGSTRPSVATTPIPVDRPNRGAQLNARCKATEQSNPALAAWLKAELAALPPQNLGLRRGERLRSRRQPQAAGRASAGPHAPPRRHPPARQGGCARGPELRRRADRAIYDLAPGDDESARRAALARWITDPRNPLTWRSIVNRVWH